ncbi:MAG TPA: hypothetical protein VLU06_04955, partial [Thermoanaerobaculia bacterium]|nr:hypothetical protein [Thermoanaerobaculia bacterium]
SAPLPVPTFAASITPTAAPTSGPDEVVIAPRIVEQRTPAETEMRPETSTRPPPTQAPAPAPTQPPPGPTNAAAVPGDTGDEPLEGVITAAKLKRFLQQWSGRPLERRARRASDVADAANFWAVTHPDDSYTAELKRWLPQALKSDTETALGNRQPVLARLSYRAYRQLKFSPPDPDLARSVRQAAP